MRYTILAIFLTLVLAFSATAQVNFGIKAGGNMAKLTGDGWDDVEDFVGVPVDNGFKMGFAFGLMAEFPMGESGFAIQPEVLYVMKGSSADLSVEGYDITIDLKQDYVEIPVLFKYSIPTEGSVAPSFFAGPVVAFNVASKIEWDGIPAEEAGEVPEGDVENNKSVDFGVTFGGGLGLAVGESGRLTFDLRYTLGMTEIFDDVAENDYEENKIYMTDDNDAGLKFKNSDIRLMVGFFF